MDIGIDANLIYWILLIIGGLFIFLQFKLMVKPHFKGEIIDFENLDEENCRKCKSAKKGRASLEVTVLIDNGDLIKAEVSPCMICLNRLSAGSIVGVTKLGTRMIVQPLISLREKPRLGVHNS